MDHDHPANIIATSDTTFDEDLKRPGLVLVDFYADWCGPCKILDPMLHRILAQHPAVTLLKLNVDANQATSMRFQIMSIPTIIAFKDGKQAAEPILGAQKPAIYAALIESFDGPAAEAA